MKPPLRPALIAAIFLVIAFDIACLWQFHLGAYQSEFGGHPAEAAHYVTGLLFHDYAAAGFPGNLSHFAEEYRRHYPVNASDWWPSGFHVIQAAWTLIFGEGRRSMLIMMAALATILAIQVFRALRSEFGDVLAGLGGLLLLCLPLVIEHYSMMMPEVLSASLMVAGAITWGRYLEHARARDALIFGALAGLATLVSASGLALVIQALLALAFTRRWHLLTRPATWGALAIAALLAGPSTWESHPAWQFSRDAIPLYLGTLGTTLGPILLVLFGIGALSKLRQAGPRVYFWAATAAQLVSAMVFPLILPGSVDARHLIPAFPPIAMFIIAGLDSVRQYSRSRRHLPKEVSSVSESLACIVLAGIGLWLVHRLSPPAPKQWTGFKSMAEEVVEDPAMTSAAVLVSSDARGGGMFISELAMMEKRPGHVVRCADEELSVPQPGREAKPKYESDDELIGWFKGAGKNVGCVVVDASMPEANRRPHHDQLIRLCEDHSEMFWLVSSSPVVRQGVLQPGPVKLYQLRRGAK